MSSTTSTSRPSIGVSRSLRMRTTPLERVPAPYDEIAMKSTFTGMSRCAHEVGQEDEAALQHAHHERLAVVVVARDLGGELDDPRLDRVLVEQRLVHEAVGVDHAGALRVVAGAKDSRARRRSAVAARGSVRRSVPTRGMRAQGLDVEVPERDAGAGGRVAQGQALQGGMGRAQAGEVDAAVGLDELGGQPVEQLALVGGQGAGAGDVRLGGRVQAGQHGQHVAPDAVARGAAVVVRGVVAPRARRGGAARARTSARVRSSSGRTQRPARCGRAGRARTPPEVARR